MLYIAIGILGATVMPHNLYLHSSLVQTRNFERTAEGKREAIRFATIDSTIALTFALFVNAAILIVSAATFYSHGYNDVAEIKTPTNCSRRCWASPAPAPCSRWPCWLPDRTPP